MRFQGKISHWNDDKGFGFVEPNGGGERAFVHVKAFQSRDRRPVNGDIIVYELTYDQHNRNQAVNIHFSHTAKAIKKQSAYAFKQRTDTQLGNILTVLFCLGLTGSILIGKLPAIVAGIYLLMSLVAFIAYAIDKSAAQAGRWRTKERTLHLIAIIGGWPGALLAQRVLRHKTSKPEFQLIYKVCIVVNIAGLIWLHTQAGMALLNQWH